MFRSSVLRAVRTVSVPKVATVAPRVVVPRSVAFPTMPLLSLASTRFYSAPALLTQGQVEGRILELLKGFDKVSEAQLIHELHRY